MNYEIIYSFFFDYIKFSYIIFYGIKRNNNFINIFKIVTDHFKIFDGAKKHIIVLYFVPILTSIGISVLYTFSDSMVEAIMVVISVVISALLSFQGGILNIESNKNEERKKVILEETNASINFTVLINIILVLSLSKSLYLSTSSLLTVIQYLILIVSLVMIAFTKKAQGLHDIIVKTEVVQSDIVKEDVLCTNEN